MIGLLLAWIPIGIALELLLLLALVKRKRRLPTLAAQLLALSIGIPLVLRFIRDGHDTQQAAPARHLHEGIRSIHPRKDGR